MFASLAEAVLLLRKVVIMIMPIETCSPVLGPRGGAGDHQTSGGIPQQRRDMGRRAQGVGGEWEQIVPRRATCDL